jgi:methyl-accepting chemotaxis protein
MILRNSIYAILVFLITVIIYTYLITNQPDKYIDEILFLILLASIGVLYLVLYFLILRPLERVARKAQDIAKGNLHQTIPSEIGELGQTVVSFNHIIHNINEATDFIKKVEKGNMEVALASNALKGENPLSNALRTMSWQIQKIAEEERRRNWATEGMAQFVYILRSNHDDIQVLCDNIISTLVKYVKVQQGGLFVVNDATLAVEQRYLEMYACYAFNEQQFEQKRIEVGEGLVGQAYLQGTTVLLKEVPEDYYEIVSGLGNSKPKNVLIVPMKVNQSVFGVIELASFFAFEPYQVEFVEKLGENIAATIANVKSNEKTKQLLEDAQTFAEQLRSQEEEMRQNVEELQSTQEEMERRQDELETINKQMESNENVLKKAFEKSRDKEKELQSKQKEIEQLLNKQQEQEEQMRRTIDTMRENENYYKNRIEELEQKINKINK